jgi:hypothetical protein
MKNKNEEIIAQYNKISDEIYNNIHALKVLIASEGYKSAQEYDENECDGDNCLVGCLEAFIENLSEIYR